MKNLFKKKSLLSLLLAFAMVFSFVGINSTAFANGPGTGNESGVATQEFNLTMTTQQDGIVYNQLIKANTTGLSDSDYSIVRRNGKTDLLTGNGFDLKQFIQSNIPANTGKTIDDITSIVVICNDLDANGDLAQLEGVFTPEELFGTTANPLYYYAPGSSAGTPVPTTVNFTVGITGGALNDESAVRLLVGQSSTTDANMPKCLKWIDSIEVIFN